MKHVEGPPVHDDEWWPEASSLALSALVSVVQVRTIQSSRVGLARMWERMLAPEHAVEASDKLRVERPLCGARLGRRGRR